MLEKQLFQQFTLQSMMQKANIFLILIVLIASEVQGQDQKYLLELGSSLLSYGRTNEPLQEPYISLVNLSNDRIIYGFKFSNPQNNVDQSYNTSIHLAYKKTDSLTWNFSVSTASGKWLPALNVKAGLNYKWTKVTQLNFSAASYSGNGQDAIVVLQAGMAFQVKRQTFNISLINQLNREQGISPTLVCNWLALSQKENIFCLFGQTGYHNVLDLKIANGSAVLFKTGAGMWFLKSISKNFKLLGSASYDAFSNDAKSLFSAGRYSLGIQTIITQTK